MTFSEIRIILFFRSGSLFQFLAHQPVDQLHLSAVFIGKGVLENNRDAERLYRREGFRETGRRNAITDRLDEIEFSLSAAPA